MKRPDDATQSMSSWSESSNQESSIDSPYDEEELLGGILRQQQQHPLPTILSFDHDDDGSYEGDIEDGKREKGAGNQLRKKPLDREYSRQRFFLVCMLAIVTILPFTYHLHHYKLQRILQHIQKSRPAPGVTILVESQFLHRVQFSRDRHVYCPRVRDLMWTQEIFNITTDAVLVLEDEAKLSCQQIQYAEERWRQHPERIVPVTKGRLMHRFLYKHIVKGDWE